MAWGELGWGNAGTTGGSSDVTPPAVTFSPAVGTPVTRHQTIKISITDTGGVTSLVVMADFPSYGISEVVYKDGQFTPRYRLFSYIQGPATALTLGVRRFGGWSATPELRVIAGDAGGNTS